MPVAVKTDLRMGPSNLRYTMLDTSLRNSCLVEACKLHCLSSAANAVPMAVVVSGESGWVAYIRQADAHFLVMPLPM
jgi:hypothetical protein